jgi:hypothetical protein
MASKDPTLRTKSRRKSAAKKSLSLKSSRDKVRAYRNRMHAKGFRLVQMWLPDTRTSQFAAEARRQSLLANQGSFAEQDQAWVDSMSDWNVD